MSVKLLIMKQLTNAIAILVLLIGVSASFLPANAQDVERLDTLLEELADPETSDWERVEDQIIDIWSRSGSISIDLLLQRGRDAMDVDDYRAAVEHFTALTDHAPDFAEGWNMRATAFYLIDEFGLAIEDLGRTLALNPKHFGALNGLGVILENIQDSKNALLAYRAAYEINPHRDNVIEAIERLEAEVDGRSI